MKLGLFGGSFDPVHLGHVLPVLEARELLRLDRVVYLPTARPPHKPGRQFAPSTARLAMVEIALLDQPSLQVSALELTPGRTAYTVDTVEHFRAGYPDAELFLLMGGDSFRALESWKRWRDLPRLATLVVLVRPGWEVERTRGGLSSELEELAGTERVIFLENAAVAVSSTELRTRIASGEPIEDGTLDPRVLQYLRKYSLYS